MAISTGIVESWKLPLFYATVDGSQAGGLSETQPVLIVGQMLASGSATPNVAVPVGSLSLAQAMFGAGSLLERQFGAFFQNNTTADVYALPMLDPTASVGSTGSITINTAVSSSGIVTLYVADQKVAIAVYTQDTTATIATKLAVAINAITTVTVVAAAATNVVTLTSKNKGDLSNDCMLTFNAGGLNAGEYFPLGFSATLVQMSGGQGEPDFTAAISNIMSQSFSYVCMPYSDSGSLGTWDYEFGFQSGGRGAFDRAQYGIIFNAAKKDYADGMEFGLNNNSAVISTMIAELGTLSPAYEVAAAYCAKAAYFLEDDPARPLATLPLSGIVPAPSAQRFSRAEINNLTGSGLAVQTVAPGGIMAIVRETMQYQLNEYGQSDVAFGLATTLATLFELIARCKALLTAKFARVKLAPNGTAFGPGNAVVTPDVIAGELIAEATGFIFDGLMIDFQGFVDDLIVEIDDTNDTRCNILWPPRLMPGLRQIAMDAQFRL